MPVTWTAEKYQKLLSAVIAAHPEFKFNYREIAVYFGENTTYDAIEGCFRPLKKKATVLRDEVESGARPKAPAGPSHRKRAKRVRGESEISDRATSELMSPAPTVKRSRTSVSATPSTTREISEAKVTVSPVAEAKKKVRKPTPEVVIIDDEEDEVAKTVKKAPPLPPPQLSKSQPQTVSQPPREIKPPISTPKKLFSKPAAPVSAASVPSPSFSKPASTSTSGTTSFNSSFSSTSSFSQAGSTGTPTHQQRRYAKREYPSEDESDGDLY